MTGSGSAMRKRMRAAALVSESAQWTTTSWADHSPGLGRHWRASAGTVDSAALSRAGPAAYCRMSVSRSSWLSAIYDPRVPGQMTSQTRPEGGRSPRRTWVYELRGEATRRGQRQSYVEDCCRPRTWQFELSGGPARRGLSRSGEVSWPGTSGAERGGHSSP